MAYISITHFHFVRQISKPLSSMSQASGLTHSRPHQCESVPHPIVRRTVSHSARPRMPTPKAAFHSSGT
jgi:hypothetical protein